MSGNIPAIYVGNANLLLLAEILETADEKHAKHGEPAYSQLTWQHPCGTPACAIGHWNSYKRRSFLGNTSVCARDFAMLRGGNDWAHLFGYRGGYPKTAKDSAARIRAFVERRAAAETGVEP